MKIYAELSTPFHDTCGLVYLSEQSPVSPRGDQLHQEGTS
jgi:hypothetical protein